MEGAEEISPEHAELNAAAERRRASRMGHESSGGSQSDARRKTRNGDASSAEDWQTADGSTAGEDEEMDEEERGRRKNAQDALLQGGAAGRSAEAFDGNAAGGRMET